MAASQIARAVLDAIGLVAAGVSDADLPAAARRNRAAQMRDSGGTVLAVGDAVTVPGGEANIVGHGRGMPWLCIAFVEDGVNNYGTLHKRFVTKI